MKKPQSPWLHLIVLCGVQERPAVITEEFTHQGELWLRAQFISKRSGIVLGQYTDIKAANARPMSEHDLLYQQKEGFIDPLMAIRHRNQMKRVDERASYPCVRKAQLNASAIDLLRECAEYLESPYPAAEWNKHQARRVRAFLAGQQQPQNGREFLATTTPNNQPRT